VSRLGRRTIKKRDKHNVKKIGSFCWKGGLEKIFGEGVRTTLLTDRKKKKKKKKKKGKKKHRHRAIESAEGDTYSIGARTKDR